MHRNSFFPLLFCLSLILFPLAAEISGPGENGPWSASDIPNPTEAGTGYVTSIGGYLTDGETAGINDLVLGIERDTSIEIAVVVVPSLAEDIFTEAQELFDRWKIGKAGVDNGLLILAAIEDRNIRTHTGYGMEGLFTDAGISVLQESIIVPAFREGRYGDGLIAYVTEIDRIIRDPAAAAELRAAGNLLDQDRARTRTLRERFSNFGENALPFFMFGGAGFLILISAVVSFVKEFRAVLKNRRKKFATYSSIQILERKGLGKQGFFLPVFFFPLGAVFFSIGLAIGGFLEAREIVFAGIIFPASGLLLSLAGMRWSSIVRNGIIRRWRESPRTCPECGGEMTRLSETDDDAYLKQTQVREEELKSVDYDVHVCSACGTTTTEQFRGRKYAVYSTCPTCNALASRQTKRELVRKPTYSSSGEALVHFECLACSAVFTKSSSIPRLTRSSSSSGSSGRSSGSSSSFGGGSSGGGGSTSSW